MQTHTSASPARLTSILLLGLASLAPAASAQSTQRSVLPTAGVPIEAGIGETQVVELYVNPDFVYRGAVANAASARRAGFERTSQREEIESTEEASSLCYVVQGFVGNPYPMVPGEEVLDWGFKSCGASSIVTQLRVIYYAENLATWHGGPGSRIGLRIYQGTTGPDPSNLGVLVAEYDFSFNEGADPTSALGRFNDVTLPTPLVLPDGPLGWSYVYKEAGTKPALIPTAGSSCASPAVADPTTGTRDCLAWYTYPASATTYHYSWSPVPGQGSMGFGLFEEDPYPATVLPYSSGGNPDSFISSPMKLGQTWGAAVDLNTTGHTGAWVFGFDTPAELPLGAGQVLLIIDSGGGELLGLAPQPGPYASFSHTIPLDASLIGRYVGTQALHYGGVVPFALSNAMDHWIGTP